MGQVISRMRDTVSLSALFFSRLDGSTARRVARREKGEVRTHATKEASWEMASTPEVLVHVRVVSGKKTISTRAKLFEESATMKTIIDGELSRSTRSLASAPLATRVSGRRHWRCCSRREC